MEYTGASFTNSDLADLAEIAYGNRIWKSLMEIAYGNDMPGQVPEISIQQILRKSQKK